MDIMVTRSKIALFHAHTSSALSMQSCKGGFFNASSIQDLGPWCAPRLQTKNTKNRKNRKKGKPYHCMKCDCCPGSMPKWKYHKSVQLQLRAPQGSLSPIALQNACVCNCVSIIPCLLHVLFCLGSPPPPSCRCTEGGSILPPSPYLNFYTPPPPQLHIFTLHGLHQRGCPIGCPSL